MIGILLWKKQIVKLMTSIIIKFKNWKLKKTPSFISEDLSGVQLKRISRNFCMILKSRRLSSNGITVENLLETHLLNLRVKLMFKKLNHTTKNILVRDLL